MECDKFGLFPVVFFSEVVKNFRLMNCRQTPLAVFGNSECQTVSVAVKKQTLQIISYFDPEQLLQEVSECVLLVVLTAVRRVSGLHMILWFSYNMFQTCH